MALSDKVFSGSIAEIYDTFLVPLIFEDYAADLARRVADVEPAEVLETAAGTGVRQPPSQPHIEHREHEGHQSRRVIAMIRIGSRT